MARLKFNGVVLAGGLSTRMGQDKALLKFQNETMLARTIRLLREAGSEHVFVSRNKIGQESIQDIYPQHGPLSGIHAGLFTQDLPVLCVPIDMPYIDSDLLRTLAESGMQMESIVTYVNHNLPIFVPNNIGTKKYLEQTLTTDRNKSIRHFLLSMGSSHIVTKDTYKLLNVNNPIEWKNVTTSITEEGE